MNEAHSINRERRQQPTHDLDRREAGLLERLWRNPPWIIRHLKKLIFGPERRPPKRLRWWHFLVSFLLFTALLAAEQFRSGGADAIANNLGRIAGIPAFVHVLLLSFMAHRLCTGRRRRWCLLIQVLLCQVMLWSLWYVFTSPPNISVEPQSPYLIYYEETEQLYPVSKAHYDQWPGRKTHRTSERDQVPQEHWVFQPVATASPPSALVNMFPPWGRQADGREIPFTVFHLLLAFAFCFPIWFTFGHTSLILSELCDTTRIFKWILLVFAASIVTTIGLYIFEPQLVPPGLYTHFTIVTTAGFFLLSLLFAGVKDQHFLRRLRSVWDLFLSFVIYAILTLAIFFTYRAVPAFREFVDQRWYVVPAAILFVLGQFCVQFVLCASSDLGVITRILKVREIVRTVILTAIFAIATILTWNDQGVRGGLFVLVVSILFCFPGWRQLRKPPLLYL